MTILCIGTSNMAGACKPKDGGYRTDNYLDKPLTIPGQIAKLQPVPVYNLSRPGIENQEIIHLCQKVIQQLIRNPELDKPTAVVIELRGHWDALTMTPQVDHYANESIAKNWHDWCNTFLNNHERKMEDVYKKNKKYHVNDWWGKIIRREVDFAGCVDSVTHPGTWNFFALNSWNMIKVINNISVAKLDPVKFDVKSIMMGADPSADLVTWMKRQRPAESHEYFNWDNFDLDFLLQTWSVHVQPKDLTSPELVKQRWRAELESMIFKFMMLDIPVRFMCWDGRFVQLPREGKPPDPLLNYNLFPGKSVPDYLRELDADKYQATAEECACGHLGEWAQKAIAEEISRLLNSGEFALK